MNPRRGLAYAVLAAASYALMSFLVHWNPDAYSVREMALVRGVITFLGVLPFCWHEVGAFFAPGARLLWARSFLGVVGLFLYYYALQGTVSGNANFLFWGTTPLFVSALSWVWLRERLSRTEASGIGLILLANVLLYIPTRSSMPLWVWEVGLAGAFVSSLAYLTLGSATKRYSSALIVLGFGLLSVVSAAFWPDHGWVSPSPQGWFFLVTTGLLGLSSQLFTTLSFAHLKSGVATSFGRLSVPFSAGLDLSIAGYHPHGLEWASYFVVIAGVALAQKPDRTLSRNRLFATGRKPT